MGFAAVHQLTHGFPRFTALYFHSVRHGTLDFHQTLPRGPPFLCFTLLSSVLYSSFVPHGSDARRPVRPGDVFRLSPAPFLGGGAPSALVSLVWGSLRQGPQRIWSHIVAPPVLRSCQSHKARDCIEAHVRSLGSRARQSTRCVCEAVRGGLRCLQPALR